MGRARERDEVVEKRGRSLEAMLADAMSAPACQVLQERLIQVATAPFACRTVWARPGASRPWHLTSILREFPRQVLHDRSFPGQHGSSNGHGIAGHGPPDDMKLRIDFRFGCAYFIQSNGYHHAAIVSSLNKSAIKSSTHAS